MRQRAFRTSRRRQRSMPVWAGVLALTFGSMAWAQPEVRFTAPRHLSTALGTTTVTLAVSVPSGAAVERIELLVDGKPLATLTAPPWELEWEAGDGIRGHSLRAVLYLTDGRQDDAFVRTSPLRINQVEKVDLVNLYALVRDNRRNYVSDLDRDDFRILENGRPQTISQFTTERKPLRVGIVLDTSLSMGGRNGTSKKLKNARKAALEFLDVLKEGDEGMVVTFNDYVHVAQDLTNNRDLMAAAITEAQSFGGTALYDAIWRTAAKLRDFDGRRVMILLSDGQDEAANGFEPGSLHTLPEALEQALRSEVMVFAIGLGQLNEPVKIWDRDLRGRSNVDPDRTLASILQQIAGDTGGRALISASSSTLRKAFNDVADDLRNQYLIGYTSDDERRDGKWREIVVQVPERKLEVVTRRGYYAPGPNDEDEIHDTQ